MNIAICFNVRHVKPSMDNELAMIEAEFDEVSTIRGIKKALKSLGHTVIEIEANDEAFNKFKKLRNKIDLVFNIAEGIYGADREAHIPAILEMLRIPYVGSKPLAQALCLDKAKTKEILAFHNIPTPSFMLFECKSDKPDKKLKYPLIIKPNFEGSSKGIFQKSIVKNEKELIKMAKEIIEKFHQPALAEEFLPGREFTVGLIGNKDVLMLPIVEVDFSKIPKNYYPIDSYEVKWLIDNPNTDTDTIICPAEIDKKLHSKIREICLKTKKVLGVLDWCRIDIRLDSKGVPNVIEINQIPGIIPDPKENSRFPLSARRAGISYEEMLNKIMKEALLRYRQKC